MVERLTGLLAHRERLASLLATEETAAEEVIEAESMEVDAVAAPEPATARAWTTMRRSSLLLPCRPKQ